MGMYSPIGIIGSSIRSAFVVILPWMELIVLPTIRIFEHFPFRIQKNPRISCDSWLQHLCSPFLACVGVDFVQTWEVTDLYSLFLEGL
jgi:hypothetical protein